VKKIEKKWALDQGGEEGKVSSANDAKQQGDHQSNFSHFSHFFKF
jgi:hypothetical protein